MTDAKSMAVDDLANVDAEKRSYLAPPLDDLVYVAAEVRFYRSKVDELCRFRNCRKSWFACDCADTAGERVRAAEIAKGALAHRDRHLPGIVRMAEELLAYLECVLPLQRRAP